MRDFTVAAVSCNSLLAVDAPTLRTNLERVRTYAERAKAAGAELVLFPELMIHGHCTPNTREVAERVPGGPSCAEVLALAAELELTISVGLSELDDGRVFNTQVLCGPRGYIGRQRKVHCSRDEKLQYSGGRALAVHDLGFCKVGTAVCYDAWFPEICRALVLRGAEVLLLPHAAREGRWTCAAEEPAARRADFEVFSLCGMRSRENGVYSVLAGAAGKTQGVPSLPADHPNQPHHAGGALIFRPTGRLMAHTQLERVEDEMCVAALDARELRAARTHPNWQLRTREHALFALLGEPTPPGLLADEPPDAGDGVLADAHDGCAGRALGS